MELTDGVGVGPEHLVDVGNTLFEGLGLLAVLVQFVEVGNQIVRVNLVLLDLDLVTHAGLDSLLKGGEVDVAFLLRV